MQLWLRLMMASVGSTICGSGTSSTETLRLPCQVTAFNGLPLVAVPARLPGARLLERLPDTVASTRTGR